MFVTPAYAQAAGGAGMFGGLGGLESLLPLVLIFVVFYFLLIRPQQKKQKQHREMLAAVRRGDRVVTAGGIIGQVVRVVSDSELIIEIADGVRVRLVRAMVSDVLAKTEPKGGETDEEADEGGDKDSPSETKKS